jgi:hypothetical protein
MDKPTPEFLAELLERARHYGWEGDYHEVISFVRHLYAEAGMSLPEQEIEPYEGE